MTFRVFIYVIKHTYAQQGIKIQCLEMIKNSAKKFAEVGLWEPN